MSVKPIPEGYHTITPYLSVKNVKQLIEFLQKAFNAEVKDTLQTDDGIIRNAEVLVGTSMIMLGEAPENFHMPIMLYMYVDDIDATFNQAIVAGAKEIMPPTNQFYGDRSGAVEDASGNQWWIASRIENVSKEELLKRAQQK